jgi:TetR/AcrR family transcriptional repressor of nem operon
MTNQVDTAKQILDTAEQLVQTRGYNAFSYADIANRVGIRKASIHYHFPTKENLMAALLDRYCDNFLQIVDRIIASGDSAITKLRNYCRLFETTLTSGNHDKICLCGMLGAEVTTLNHSLVERVTAFYTQNELRLVQILTEGRENKEFNFPGDIKSMASLILSLLEGGMLIARTQGGNLYYEAVVEQLMHLVKG